MRRTVIVGDVHGCREELEALLSVVGYAQGVDRLIFVGDLVARGPDSHGVLALVAKLSARAVLGNHENKLLGARGQPHKLSGEHRRLAEALSPEQWAQLEAMPLWIDLPEHDACVVHAGVLPGQPVERTSPRVLLTIRAISKQGEWTDDKDARPRWGQRYVGPPHIVFGHNALPDPQLHPWATGIDTGCVYGRRLTALVLAENEPLPRGEDARAKLVSVRAKRKYYVSPESR